jgi:hypothetical protein
MVDLTLRSESFVMPSLAKRLYNLHGLVSLLSDGN